MNNNLSTVASAVEKDGYQDSEEHIANVDKLQLKQTSALRDL